MSGPAWSKRAPQAKRHAIEAIALPAGFNGLIAYGRGGRIEHLRCAGFADVETRQPVTAATSFRWGSASKWLTSVAALRLVEQKRLDLEAPVGRYLTGLRPDSGQRVLLKHLLSNTSGIPDLLSRQIAVEPELRTSAASAASIVTRFAHGDLSFAPGEGWDYAALNWVIVAALLNQVAGVPFPDLIQQQVLRPLRMSGAGFVQADQPPVPRLAAAYDGATPRMRKMAPVPPFLAASGNVAGSVEDAFRAVHGIFHGALLAPASRRALTTIHWPDQQYALGGRVRTLNDEPWAWETGKVQGYRTHIAHRLATSETIVVFNTTDMLQSTITDWVEGIARA